MTLPTKPISKACVYYAGERAAGINASTFNLDVWIDLGCCAEEERGKFLNDVRKRISNTYEEMLGDAPTWVMFDFEWEEQNRIDNER